jgi:hypothetical protein
MCYGCKRDFGPAGELVYEAEKLLLHEVKFHGSKYRFCAISCINLADVNRDLTPEALMEIRRQLEPRALEQPGQRPPWRRGK